MYPVLLVDDEKMIKKSMRKMIEASGGPFEVCGEAKNGEEALDIAAKHPPRLIITDIRMPLMDGLQLIEETQKRLLSIEFIIVSGFSEFAYAQKALQLGAFDFLLKPVRPHIFLDTLRRVGERLDNEQSVMKERLVWLKLCKSHALPLAESIWLLDDAKSLSGWRTTYAHFADCPRSHIASEEICLHLQFFIEEELANKNPEKRDVPLVGAWKWAKSWTENETLMADYLLQIIQSLRKTRNFGSNHFVSKALEYAAGNFHNEHLSLQTAADHIGITAPYLSRCFREETGQNFIQYVTNFRMEKAKRMLQEQPAKVYEVAYSTGYQEYAHFCRVFRKYTGYSPTEYRKITGNY